MQTGRIGSNNRTKKNDNLSPLPNSREAVVSSEKINGYVLNFNHPVGKHKARAFEKILGYNQSNSESLVSQIQACVDKCSALPGKKDAYGQRYEVNIPIKGPNGSTAIVRTGWIIRTDSNQPELITVYIKDGTQ
ncbi:MAG: DUF6883 domain-containing protein [Thermoguttaceae bacterium]